MDVIGHHVPEAAHVHRGPPRRGPAGARSPSASPEIQRPPGGTSVLAAINCALVSAAWRCRYAEVPGQLLHMSLWSLVSRLSTVKLPVGKVQGIGAGDARQRLLAAPLSGVSTPGAARASSASSGRCNGPCRALPPGLSPEDRRPRLREGQAGGLGVGEVDDTEAAGRLRLGRALGALGLTVAVHAVGDLDTSSCVLLLSRSDQAPTTLAAYIQGALLRGAARGRAGRRSLRVSVLLVERRTWGRAAWRSCGTPVAVLDLVDTAVHHVAAVGGGDHRGGQRGTGRTVPVVVQDGLAPRRRCPGRCRRSSGCRSSPRRGSAPGAPGGHTRRAGCPAASAWPRRSGWKAATSVPTTRSVAGRPRSSRSFAIAATSPLQSPPGRVPLVRHGVLGGVGAGGVEVEDVVGFRPRCRCPM